MNTTRLLFTCTLIPASLFPLSATEYQWNSASSTNWSTASAWSPNGTPGSSDTITTPLVFTGTLRIDGDRSIAGFNFDSSTGWNIQSSTSGTSGSPVTHSLTIGAGGLTKAGSGTLVIRNLDANNSLALTTSSMTVNGGNLAFGSSSSQPMGALTVSGLTTVASGASLTIYANSASLTGGLQNDGGTVSLFAGPTSGSGSITVGGINGSSGTIRTGTTASTTSTLTLDFAGTASYGGILSNGNSMNNTLILVKNGSGKQTLSGSSNVYIGGTTINNGAILVANSTGSGIGLGDATVNNGGTLGGTGIVALSGGKTLTVASGGTLLGGDGVSASGTLTINNDVTFASGSKIEISLGALGAHSSIDRTSGTWTFDSAQSILFGNIAEGAQTGVVYSGILTGLAGDPGVTGWTIANAGWSGTFSYLNGSVSVTLSSISSIPEPSSAAFISAFVVIGATVVSRRRRSITATTPVS